ncbi:MAG TPA: PIG-L deacetylase family protein [Nitrososphaeraceae archaeon]|nr:PIG-L deacetylase family protein [Nitrososphaeraceae archaeon]
MRKKVLCVGAHPDDLELGMGGTIAKHVDRNHEVHLAICTQGIGGKSGHPKLRMEEAKKAAAILGADLHLIDYPVLKLNKPSIDFKMTISNLIQRINPDRVYTHSPYDYHQIHYTVAQSVTDVIDNIKEFVYYEIISSTSPEFKPNAYVDITDYIDVKLTSLKAHQTQGSKLYIISNAVKSLAYARYTLSKIGSRPNGMAEAFTIHRLLTEGSLVDIFGK